MVDDVVLLVVFGFVDWYFVLFLNVFGYGVIVWCL